MAICWLHVRSLSKLASRRRKSPAFSGRIHFLSDPTRPIPSRRPTRTVSKPQEHHPFTASAGTSGTPYPPGPAGPTQRNTEQHLPLTANHRSHTPYRKPQFPHPIRLTGIPYLGETALPTPRTYPTNRQEHRGTGTSYRYRYLR